MLTLRIHNSHIKAESNNVFDLQAVRDCLSYRVKNFEAVRAQMVRKYGRRMANWDGKKSFLNGKTNCFPSGFLARVERHLKRASVAYRLSIEDSLVSPQGQPHVKLSGIDFGKGDYDYQQTAVDELIAAGRGTAKYPTGSGKTEIAIAVTQRMGVPTLFLSHRVNLAHQTAQRFSTRLGRSDIGLIGDGQFDVQNITIGMVQTLHSLVKSDPKQAKILLGQFQMLFIDEGHRSGSSQFHDVAMLCTGASRRYTLTATPFMKNDIEEDMWLEGLSGEIVSSISNKLLIERGVLARPFFRFIKIQNPINAKFRKWRDIYEQGIIYNKERNMQVVQATRDMVGTGRKCLVVCLETRHGKILDEVLNKVGVRSAFVHGKHAFKERKRALDMLASGRLDVIVCTNIFDEGIDVNAIGAVVLAAGTKSAPALFQRTGRATRRKNEDNTAIIIDFIDAQHPKLHEHSIERYELVKNEDGFTII